MADFHAVEARLRSIFDPYRGSLTVSRDGPDGIYLELPGFEGKPWGYVGGTRVGKAYVSYYLMGAYDGGLASSMSPELKKRMQGKTCFNFTKIDEPLFAELEALTAKAITRQPQVVEEALAGKAAAKATAKVRARNHEGGMREAVSRPDQPRR
jgi:hypothetical protein